MSTPLKTTGRVVRQVRRALTSLVSDSFPTIEDPSSGSTIPGGEPVTVTVSTNRPEMAHDVRVLALDGSELSSHPVTFPGGESPGTASVTLPAPGTADAEYFLEVVPASGPPHRIVVVVVAAGAPLTLDIDSGGNLPGEYAPPLNLLLTGSATGGTPPYTYEWTSGGSLSDLPTLRISLTAGGGAIYTFTCTATDAANDLVSADVVYTIT